ncbi:MAG TPA: nicotinate phosphoribosyltransferase [Methylobacter sp.]|jgi:nicotinamide phosphoribosyltransferase
MTQLYVKDLNGNFVEATEQDMLPEGVFYPPLEDNLVTDADSYKYSHPYLFPEGTASLYSHFLSRGGAFSHVQFVELQAFLKKRLCNKITKKKVDECERLMGPHGEPFYREGWDAILKDYDGFAPVTLRAIPEGMVVPTGTAMFDVQLTEPDPRLHWLPAHVETSIVRQWYPNSVGTLSFHCKKHIFEALQKSSDDPLGELPFKLHDFGSRGASSEESARIGGAAHLANFLGTDTVEALRQILHYYGCKSGMPGFSIPAAEHSNRCAWGKGREFEGNRELVRKFLHERNSPPGVPKMAACVSDTYNVFNSVENCWCDPDMVDYVRSSGGVLVVRPDSGEPIDVLLKILAIFERKLGMQKNLKGYKVLPNFYRIIQGDGINIDSLPEILHAIMSRGYSASNLAFGMGGGLLQMVNRDTSKYKYAASSAFINGDWVDLFKDPVTDIGKRSMAGHIATIIDGFGQPIRSVRGPRNDDIMREVCRNGKLTREVTWDDVVAESQKSFLSLVT